MTPTLPEIGSAIKWRALKTRNGMNSARHGKFVERLADGNLVVEYSTLGLNKFKKVTIKPSQVID